MAQKSYNMHMDSKLGQEGSHQESLLVQSAIRNHATSMKRDKQIVDLFSSRMKSGVFCCIKLLPVWPVLDILT